MNDLRALLGTTAPAPAPAPVPAAAPPPQKVEYIKAPSTFEPPPAHVEWQAALVVDSVAAGTHALHDHSKQPSKREHENQRDERKEASKAEQMPKETTRIA